MQSGQASPSRPLSPLPCRFQRPALRRRRTLDPAGRIQSWLPHPCLSAWLLWSRRDACSLASAGRAWTGLGLIALAVLMLAVGELSALFVLSHVGFVVALLGAVLGVGGYSLLRVTATPVLLFSSPYRSPTSSNSVLTWRLQLLSSELGVQFIRLFQIPVYLEGNVIDLGHYQLQVVEACSGLRYLYPLLSLSFLAAYFFHAPFWQRAVVFSPRCRSRS